MITFILCFLLLFFSPHFILHLTALSLKPEPAFPRPAWGSLQEMVVIHSGALCSGFLVCFYSGDLSKLWKSLSDSMLTDTLAGIGVPFSHVTV